MMASQASQRVETARGEIKTIAHDEVIPYVQAHLQPGTRVFVYPYFPLYYFLTQLVNPTPYEYLQPGMHTAEDLLKAQRALAHDSTPVVLFDPGFWTRDAEVWPSTPENALASDPLGDYILSHYKACRTLQMRTGSFVYMVRNDLSCPTN
jgi:hypothetical protein